MNFYFSIAQIPELSNLSKLQRRFVARKSFELLKTERPAAVAFAGLPGLGAILGCFAVAAFLNCILSEHNSLIILGGGSVLGAPIGATVGAHLFWAFMRPYFKKYIKGHEKEIEAQRETGK